MAPKHRGPRKLARNFLYIHIYIYIYIYICIYINARSSLQEVGTLRNLARSTLSSKTPYGRTKHSNSLLGTLGAACALENTVLSNKTLASTARATRRHLCARIRCSSSLGAASRDRKRCLGSLGAADCARKRCSSSLGAASRDRKRCSGSLGPADCARKIAKLKLLI